VEYRYQSGDDEKRVRIERQGDGYAVTIGERTYAVKLERSEPGKIAFTADGQHYLAHIANDSNQRYVALEGDGSVYDLMTADSAATSARRKTSAVSDNVLSAAMPGQVVKVLVAEGEAVKRGQTLVVLEAMKMEIRVTAPRDAQVIKMMCSSGEIVERGQRLVELSN
jgi:biotin carboxyl carrier protein